MTDPAGAGLYSLLAEELRRLPAFQRGSRPFLRLSRQKDSLFATDLPAKDARAAADFARRAEALGWKLSGSGGVLSLAPGEGVLRRLAPAVGDPPAGDGGAAEFCRMLYRYCAPGDPDAAFCLVLLRAIGSAYLGAREDALFPRVREAYALGLRRRAAVRAPLCCALCRELCAVLERKDRNL